MSDQQHIIDDLTQVNTVVRHTVTELRTKVLALRDTLDEQYHEDVDAVLDLVTTITQAAHSTASAAVMPVDVATVTPTVILGAGVDHAALAAQASAAEDAANGVVAEPVTAEELGEPEQVPTLTDITTQAEGVDVPGVDAPAAIVGDTAGEGEGEQVAPAEGATEPVKRARR